MAIRLLGPEHYGLWQTAGTLLTWINLSQLGIGGGLVNELGRAMGRNDPASMRRLVSTAYVSLGAIAAIVWIVLMGLSQSSVVATVLGVQGKPALLEDARVVFIITSTILSATIFVNTITSVCAGLQESYIYLLYFAGGHVLTLVSLTVLSLMGAGLGVYTVGVGLPPLIVMLALNAYMFARRHPDIVPSPALFSTGSLKSLWSFGGPLLVTQVADLFIFSSASPLIASKLGLTEVTRYSVAFALAILVVSFCDNLTRSYLGGFCEAVARHDWVWIHRIAVRTRLINFSIIGAAAVGMVVIGPFAIRVWAGKPVVPSTGLMAAMAFYACMMVISNTNTVLVLGLGNSKLKAGLQSFVAATHMIGFFLLVPKMGLYALPIAGAIGYLGDAIVSYTYTGRLVGKHLRESQLKMDLAPVGGD